MKNLIVYQKNTLENIVCSFLASLTYGNFEHLSSIPGNLDEYNMVIELKDETVKEFQEHLIDSYDKVRTTEDSLRILDSDILSLIQSIDSKDKNYHVLFNLNRMLGEDYFLSYLLNRFQKKEKEFHVNSKEIIQSNCFENSVRKYAEKIENEIIPFSMLNYNVGFITPEHYSDLVGELIEKRNPQYDFILSCDFAKKLFFVNKKENVDLKYFLKAVGGSDKNDSITIPLNPTTLLLFEQYLPYPKKIIKK